MAMSMGRDSLEKNKRNFENTNDMKSRLDENNKGNSISGSLTRMIRSSPKIHLKHHISTSNSVSSTAKNGSLTKNFQNKLYLNRLSLEKAVLN